MNVSITCFATLSNDDTCRFDRRRVITVCGESPTARTVAQENRIPQSQIATVFVNGKRTTIDHQLAEGDRVAFVPAVGGM